MVAVSATDIHKKFRRNMVIIAAHEAGVSERVLADVFDIPVAEVEAIISLLSYVVEDDDEEQD